MLLNSKSEAKEVLSQERLETFESSIDVGLIEN